MDLPILLVEDHLDLAANLWQFLESCGYSVDHAANGIEALRRITTERYAAVVLDLGLPGLDGIEVLKAARARALWLPILALTARDSLDDKLNGFAAGADDYVVKPVALPELAARLGALLRRPTQTAPVLEFGPLCLDPQSMTLRRGNRTILLTPTLGRLLQTLMARAPQRVDHETLIAQTWQGADADVNALHTQISALRALLDRPFGSAMIKVDVGLGYRLELPP